MGRRKKEERFFAPGASDMTIGEAFVRVLNVAESTPLNDERDKQAVDLIRALAIGSYFGSYKEAEKLNGRATSN